MFSAHEAKKKADFYHEKNLKYKMLEHNVVKRIITASTLGKYHVKYIFEKEDDREDILNLNNALIENGYRTMVVLDKPYGHGCNLTNKVIEIFWGDEY